MIAASKEV